jgi:hypothetical protein
MVLYVEISKQELHKDFQHGEIENDSWTAVYNESCDRDKLLN